MSTENVQETEVNLVENITVKFNQVLGKYHDLCNQINSLKKEHIKSKDKLERQVSDEKEKLSVLTAQNTTVQEKLKALETAQKEDVIKSQKLQEKLNQLTKDAEAKVAQADAAMKQHAAGTADAEKAKLASDQAKHRAEELNKQLEAAKRKFAEEKEEFLQTQKTVNETHLSDRQKIEILKNEAESRLQAATALEGSEDSYKVKYETLLKQVMSLNDHVIEELVVAESTPCWNEDKVGGRKSKKSRKRKTNKRNKSKRRRSSKK